jgi:nucleotide-binding universal stress UspA family protein
MLRVMVPIDGSPCSLRAIRHVVAMKDTLRPALEVLLINVRPPIPMLEMMRDGRPSDVHRLEEPLKEQGQQTLAAARLALDQAGIENRAFVEIGEAARLITDYSKTYHCEMIVMGTHGMGATVSLLLGSVATKVLHLASMPVVLVP